MALASGAARSGTVPVRRPNRFEDERYGTALRPGSWSMTGAGCAALRGAVRRRMSCARPARRSGAFRRSATGRDGARAVREMQTGAFEAPAFEARAFEVGAASLRPTPTAPTPLDPLRAALASAASAKVGTARFRAGSIRAVELSAAKSVAAPFRPAPGAPTPLDPLRAALSQVPPAPTVTPLFPEAPAGATGTGEVRPKRMPGCAGAYRRHAETRR